MMPTEIAAHGCRIGCLASAPLATSRLHASCNAIQPPQIDAVRVPPSACSTSQSTVICTSGMSRRSVAARSDRPISRWISCVRPLCLPLRGFATDALGRRTRQHRVLGGDPALARALQPRRDALLDRRGAQHARAPELDEHRTVGHLGEVAHEDDAAQVVGGAAGGTCGQSRSFRPPRRTAGRWCYRCVTRCGAASVTACPNASEPSSTEATGSSVGHKWVSISRRAFAARAASPAWRAERWIGARMSSC